MDAGVPRHHGILNSALLSVIEALLLHGETCPVTGLPARATSAASNFFEEDKRWGEANRSLWPNPEFHGGSLPAMPALDLSRVHIQNNTDWTGSFN
jgi:hypothetical protein